MQRRIDNGGKPSTRGTGSKVSGVVGLGGPWDARGFEAHVGVQTRVTTWWMTACFCSSNSLLASAWRECSVGRAGRRGRQNGRWRIVLGLAGRLGALL